MSFELPDIEQAAVSCIMQWPQESMRKIEDYSITTEHFQVPRNCILFDCLKNFWTTGKPIELICFTQELRELHLLETVGGALYLTQTWCNTCHAIATLDYYLGIIKEAHARRVVAATCAESIKQIGVAQSNPVEVAAEASGKLSAIPLSLQPRIHRTLLEAVTEKLHRMENGQPEDDILKTGIARLDELSPLRRGDMPLIAGERKAGKSILALTVILNMAKQGVPCLYFSLEDREPKIIDRLFAAVSRMPMNKHHVSRLQGNDLSDATRASSTLSGLPIHIKDDVFDLLAITNIARELKARCQIGLIVVDYGQLVRVQDRKDVNREQKVAEVSRTLRLLAMELDTPIIVLSQLNSEGQTRESRALEQDATAMWQIAFTNSKEHEHGKRLIQIPWQRNGESGIQFPVTFLGAIARVENCAQGYNEGAEL